MKTIDYRFNLDLHTEGAQTIKNVQRGDNYVKLIVTFSEEGKPYPLSGIATVKFAAAKADGNYIYDNAQIVNNSVEFILTGQCTAAAGLMVCQFKLIDGSGHIKASPTFALNICENAYDEQPIVESSDEFNALTLTIADLEQKLASGYFKGDKGDKGDPGDAIVEVSHFNLATDPKTIYKVSISGGNQYFVFVIRSASAITQWRFTPKDIAQGQTADISIRTGTISTAGFSEIITWEDHWTRLFDFLELVDESTAAEMIATAAYTKAQVNTLINDLNTAKANKTETYTKTQVDNLISAIDISGKVDKTQKIAGIALSGDISKDDLVDNIHSKINPANVVSGQTNGYLGQYGSTADKKPMFYTGMSNWAELAKASDIPDISGKMDLASLHSGGSTEDIELGQLFLTRRGLSDYNLNIQLSQSGESGRQIAWAGDIPDVSGKADAATTLAGYGITDAYTKAETNGLVNDLNTAKANKSEVYSKSQADSLLSGKVSKQTSLPSVATVEQQGQYVVDTTDSSFQNLAITQMFTAEISEVVYTYQKTGANTYIMLTGLAHMADIPDISGKEDKSNKVEQVQDSSSTTQYPSIKAMTTYVTLGLSNKEATANRVTSINASSDNSHYPTAKAVKDYVDTVIGGIENGSY